MDRKVEALGCPELTVNESSNRLNRKASCADILGVYDAAEAAWLIDFQRIEARVVTAERRAHQSNPRR
jgi:hypothetical protein